MPDDRRVAVIGMALRFPGAETPEQYWRDIEAGVSHVRRFTRAELRAAGAPEDLLDDPDLVGASALLDGVDGFDAAFFGMSGREAAVTDPQQRLFLECCHHALEDGGYAGSDARIGVYGSVGYRLYSLHSYLANNLADVPGDDWIAQKQIQVGNYPDFAANRAAFQLGLRGPAVNVATACSSALVSVHLACQALLAGDAELMLVGSAALHLPQITGHRHVRGSTISRSGTVRAFDADADGTVGGNGVAAVLLKPLSRALADGDTVHAVILGSAVTNDGDGKAGFAAPGVAGQRDAVLGALERADVPADSIGYLEAHGTGTFKGDPIEFAALTEAFRVHTDGRAFCALGSAKPAIGHLDSASGLAALIKAVLVLRHGVIPPLVNFSRANPRLAVESSPFVLPTRAAPWPDSGVRRAGVHSIGMGGTNAHTILEEAPGPSRGRGTGARVWGVPARRGAGGGTAAGAARRQDTEGGAVVPGVPEPWDAQSETAAAGAPGPRDAEGGVTAPGALEPWGTESEAAAAGAAERQDAEGGAVVSGAPDSRDTESETAAAGAPGPRDAEGGVAVPGAPEPRDTESETAEPGASERQDAEGGAVVSGAPDSRDTESETAAAGAPRPRDAEGGVAAPGAPDPWDTDSNTAAAGAPGPRDAEGGVAAPGAPDPWDTDSNTAAPRTPEAWGGDVVVPGLLPLSARTPEALTAYARAFRDELVRRPDIAPADLLTTTALGRRHLPHRLVVAAPFVEGLDAFLAGAEGVLTGTVDRPVSPAFVFSGQGAGGPGTAAALAARFPVVAEVLRECARIYREETGEDDFLDRLTGEEAGREGHPSRTTDGTSQDWGPDRTVGAPASWDTAFAQPALFALQVAQVRLWRSWGVRPASVAGHSVGEYAALCTAGALSVADGMRLLCRRGRLMRDTEPGAMLAVFADRDRVRQLAAEVGQVELAVSNGPEHQVLAGPPDAVAEVHRRLTGKGLTGALLPVDRAFHSALLDPVLDDLRDAVEKTELRPVDIEFVSGLDGVAHLPGWLPDADHLVRQARHTADFHAVLRTLAPADVLLELGPGATMTRLARRAIPDTLCVPTGRSPDDLWPTVARLHCAGVAVDWAALLDGCGGRRIPLPTYPFEHRSYWIGPPPATAVLASEPDGKDDVTDQAVLDRVLDLTAQHLGHDRDGLRAGQTYVGLGADSLQLIGILRQLEGEFGVTIAVRELLEEAGSPELTAQLIADRVQRPAPAPAPEPRAEVIDAPRRSDAESTAVRHAPGAETAGSRRTPARGPEEPGPEEPGYATRADLAELRRQVDLLAETQASLITQLSEAVALLNAERAVR